MLLWGCTFDTWKLCRTSGLIPAKMTISVHSTHALHTCTLHVQTSLLRQNRAIRSKKKLSRCIHMHKKTSIFTKGPKTWYFNWYTLLQAVYDMRREYCGTTSVLKKMYMHSSNVWKLFSSKFEWWTACRKFLTKKLICERRQLFSFDIQILLVNRLMYILDMCIQEGERNQSQ